MFTHFLYTADDIFLVADIFSTYFVNIFKRAIKVASHYEIFIYIGTKVELPFGMLERIVVRLYKVSTLVTSNTQIREHSLFMPGGGGVMKNPGCSEGGVTFKFCRQRGGLSVQL